MTIEKILNEISNCLSNIEYNDINKICKLIHSFKNKQIVCIGAGRVGYSLRAFTMRLMHLGYNNVSFIGDTNVPYTGDSDTLVIIASSSGETKTNVLYANIIKNISDNPPVLLTITCNKNSTIGKMSDYVLEINTIESEQPMKTIYEQSMYILYDYLVTELMKLENKTNKDLVQNHSILE